MRILDRSIILRFLWNFAILFTLLYLFATAVDTILNVDDFLSAAGKAVEAQRFPNRFVAVLALVTQFHAPRALQFFQFMMGLVCIGAMGFTFVQMHRARELVAIMAAGVPLRRCVWAVMAAALALNVLQVLNQEYLLPHVAERLIQGHSEIGRDDGGAFAVPLTRDSAGNLLYATLLDPEHGRIQGFLALERNKNGELMRRTTAVSAAWDAQQGGWVLQGGQTLERDPAKREASSVQTQAAPATLYKTDLSPRTLTARHSRLYLQLLSSRDLREVAAAGALDQSVADRMQVGRMGSVLVNLLVLAIAVPFFLQRGPVGMMRQTMLCAGLCVPAIIVSAVLMATPIGGLPPMVSAILPIALLLPAAVARISWMPS
ncbi:MAG: LptF/LptG family permease [Phycisphaerales bacterium]